MQNTEDNKEIELKKIPRNPNIPLKDEEIAEVLKEAASQIADKGVSSKEVVKEPEIKKTESEKKEKESENKQKDNEKRENIVLTEPKKEELEEKKTEEQTKKVDENEKTNASLEKTEKEAVIVKDANKDDAIKESTLGDATKSDKNEKVIEEFEVEEVYVTPPSQKGKKPYVKNYKMTVGDVIGMILEGIWIGIKLLAVVTIVTIVVGFFMSRELMIRGRSGEQISKQGMNVAAVSISGRAEEKKAGRSWCRSAKAEKITLKADDGKILVAKKIVTDKKSESWAVILHGQNECVEDIYDIASRYANEGYNILMPDLRAHGESEGAFYGMGWLDRLDVINWIDVILAEYPAANFIIHGVDMGADTALMVSGEPLKDSVKAVVAESACTGAWDAVENEYKARHEEWPVFPVLHMMNPVMKLWAGYSLTEADTIEQVKKAKIPILLIHGANDTFVTTDMVQTINQSIISEHELLTIETGTHGDCRFAEPDVYYNKVFEFGKKHVK